MDDSYLDIIEAAHKERVGENFCYCATHLSGTKIWQLSIVERLNSGHFPVSMDFFLGSKIEVERLAAELNMRRLNLFEREAAVIVASSMVGAADDERSRPYNRRAR